jgi:hypothetical protein
MRNDRVNIVELKPTRAILGETTFVSLADESLLTIAQQTRVGIISSGISI